MPTAYQSSWMNEGLRTFRATVRQFIQDEFVPHQARWRQQRRPDLEAWAAAGAVGLLLPDVPEEYGGGGGTFAHEAVVLEELARAGIHFGASIQGIVAHYILAYGSEEQKRKWLPPPGARRAGGSDRHERARRRLRPAGHQGDGPPRRVTTTSSTARRRSSPTAGTPGLVCVAVKTDPRWPALKGISLVMVEAKGLAGYRVGCPLEKVGMHGQDTCELFFDDVRVPAVEPSRGRRGPGLLPDDGAAALRAPHRGGDARSQRPSRRWPSRRDT